MARKPKAVAGFTVTAAEPVATVDDGPSAQTTDQLGNVDDGQKAPKARIMRWNEGMRAYATLDTVAAAVVDEEWIQREYGGGKYQCYYWGTLEDGTYGYLKKKVKEFIIDDSIPFRGAIRSRISQNGAAHNPDGTPAGGGTMEALAQNQVIQLIREQNENRGSAMTMMMQMMNQQAQASQQFMQMMLTLMTTAKGSGGLGELKEIIGPILGAAVNKKDPVEIATALMAAMKESGGTRGGFELFKEFLEIKEMLGGGNGEDSEGGWMKLARELGVPALEIIKEQAAVAAAARRTGQPAPAQPRLPAPTGIRLSSLPSTPESTPPSSATPTTETKPVVQDEWTVFEAHAQRLAGFANNNADPSTIAGMVELYAPPQEKAVILSLIADAECGAKMRARFQVLAPFTDWLEDFLDELRERMGLARVQPDEDAEPAADATAGGE